MTVFIVLNLLIVLTLCILFYAFSMFWPPDSPWAPWWRTDRETAEYICKIAKIDKNDIVYDLGCGDGEVLLTAAKKYGAKGVGLEIDWPRVIFAKVKILKNGMNKSIEIKRVNFFKENLSKATVVSVYLVPRTLEKLKQKFVKELKPGTKIVSYRYEMSLTKIAEDRKRKIFVYKI